MFRLDGDIGGEKVDMVGTSIVGEDGMASMSIRDEEISECRPRSSSLSKGFSSSNASIAWND